MGARVVAAIVVLAAPVVAACSSSSSPGAPGAGDGSDAGAGSGVDGSKGLDTLSSAEKGMLCDWVARQFGGYDSRGVCADSSTGGLQGPTDPSECVVDLLPPATCTATVGQLEACVGSEVQNACDWASVSPTTPCLFLTARACGGTADSGVD